MKLTKEQKAKLTDWIEWQELCSNGLKNINGGFTIVKNLKLIKGTPPHDFIASYSLTIGEQCGGEGDYSTKHPNTTMPLPKSTVLSIINQK